MPKYPKNKKGKQPLRPTQGPDRQWTSLHPDPDPPDDQGAKAHLVAILDETPVMAGGLVIREPSPCLRTPEHSVSHTTSPQEGVIVLRPANGTSGSAEQQS